MPCLDIFYVKFISVLAPSWAYLGPSCVQFAAILSQLKAIEGHLGAMFHISSAILQLLAAKMRPESEKTSTTTTTTSTTIRCKMADDDLKKSSWTAYGPLILLMLYRSWPPTTGVCIQFSWKLCLRSCHNNSNNNGVKTQFSWKLCLRSCVVGSLDR